MPASALNRCSTTGCERTSRRGALLGRAGSGSTRFARRRLSWGGCRGGAKHGGVLDVIQLRILLVEIGFSEFRDLVLLAGGLIGVLVVEHLDDFHPLGIDHAKRGKSLRIEE